MKRADRFWRLPTGELTLRAHLVLLRDVLSSRLLDDVPASLGTRQRPRRVDSIQSRLGEAVTRACPLLVHARCCMHMISSPSAYTSPMHVAGLNLVHATIASLPVSGIPKELVVVALEAVGGVGRAEVVVPQFIGRALYNPRTSRWARIATRCCAVRGGWVSQGGSRGGCVAVRDGRFVNPRRD